MRDAFIERICERMAQGDDIFFLSADFGSPALDALRAEFADRFVNVGIAEQNLINVATGLALEGYRVIAYGIAPFVTMRAYEQLRVNLAISSQLRALNVTVVGVGAGLSYDVSGPTHHCLEDLAIMRALPHLDVYSPGDWVLAAALADRCIDRTGPKYVRMDGKPLPPLPRPPSRSDLDTGFAELRKGEEVCIVSTGFMTHTAMRVAEASAGVGVVDVFSLRPLREELLSRTLSRYHAVLTVEEGFLGTGGLGSLVGDAVRRFGNPLRVESAGFERGYLFEGGSRLELHRRAGLDTDGIAGKVAAMRSRARPQGSRRKG